MMQYLVNYSLNAGLIIMILWAGYQFALSRNTNFKTSRAALLSIYLLAALLPFMPHNFVYSFRDSLGWGKC